MMKRHPRIWLISDARNDAALEPVLRAGRAGGGHPEGLIYRHYHLAPDARRARFDRLRRIARARGIAVVLAGTMAQARAWRADGAYGPAAVIGPGGRGIRLATAHGWRDIGRARRADAVLLSPVWPTRSHIGGATLGPVRFALMARGVRMPVIALGGVTARRAARLHAGAGWAAIDGLIRPGAAIPPANRGGVS